MLKAILIDDEEIGRETLAQLLINNCTGSVTVTGQADNVQDGYKLIQKLKPDIVFLDIEMYGENGFDLLDMFDEIDFEVIFTTAYSHYSIKAIQYAAFGYLLKPIISDELKQVIVKVEKQNNKKDLTLQYEQLLKMLKPGSNLAKIAVPDASGLTFVEIAAITRCESNNNYTIIYLEGGECIMSSKCIKEYEAMLCDNNFFRVHNSHLINLSYIKRYEKGEGGLLILKDNTEIEVSRRRKQELMERIISG